MSAKNTPVNFWAHVDVGPPATCWEWKGALNSQGYGTVSWRGQPTVAHRVAYMLANGEIELATHMREPGRAKTYTKFVLHKCDNRKCCNPSHLFLGSMSDNMYDAYHKHRKAQPKSKHANAKLTPSQVRDIRVRYRPRTYSQQKLANEYGVSQVAISLIIRHKSYLDVQ